MTEPKFTGIWIPSIVLTHPVSITAKVCYGVIDGLDNEDGCFASNDYIKAVLGLETRQLQNVLRELDDAKLICRQLLMGRRIIRTVAKMALINSITGGAENCTGGVQNIAGGGCNKMHPYRKEDNKEIINTKGRKKKSLIEQLDEIPWTADLPFSSEAFSKAWQSWIDYRKELKKPLKDATVTAQWKEFTKWGEQKSIASIEQSIKNGWQGLFEPNKSFGTSNTKTLTARDHEAF